MVILLAYISVSYGEVLRVSRRDLLDDKKVCLIWFFQ